MQESNLNGSYDIKKLIGITIPSLIVVIVAMVTPFVILLRNGVPPSDPPPPGWDSSVAIYLWAANFSIGHIQDRYILGDGVTNLHALIFVAMTLIYVIIQSIVIGRKLQVKHGVVIEIVLLLIWISICQLIYGTLQDWTLIQIPLLPLVGISVLLVLYGKQRIG
jgi:hypothetical protein